MLQEGSHLFVQATRLKPKKCSEKGNGGFKSGSVNLHLTIKCSNLNDRWKLNKFSQILRLDTLAADINL